MAVPKKKVTRSRRNQRRYSAAYKLEPVSYQVDPISNQIVRPHTIHFDKKTGFAIPERNQTKPAQA
jgi:ribosomal protein L32